MNKAPLCCKCGKRATKSIPANLCDRCWYEWWCASDDEKHEWKKYFGEKKDVST